MINKERKEEIIAEVTYSVNRVIGKQSILYYALEELDEEEREWFDKNCFGGYEIECGDFE